MKITLSEKNKYDFERFMSRERHDKLQEKLILACFRQCIYRGFASDILLEITEACQTIEEALFMAMEIDEARKFMVAMVSGSSSMRNTMLALGATKPNELITEKEQFLRELENIYREAYILWRLGENNN